MMFFRSTNTRGSKKGRQIEAPQKGIYATDVGAEISLNHDALHQVFLGHEATATKTTAHPDQTPVQSSQKK